MYGVLRMGRESRFRASLSPGGRRLEQAHARLRQLAPTLRTKAGIQAFLEQLADLDASERGAILTRLQRLLPQERHP